MKLSDLDFVNMSVLEIEAVFKKNGVKYKDGSVELLKDDPRLVIIYRSREDEGIGGQRALFATWGNFDPDWDIDNKLEVAILPTFRCKRCEHRWHAKADKKPITCPRCRSPYWDTWRIQKVIKEELEHIPRGNFAQNMLREYYTVFRMNSLGKKAKMIMSAKEVLQKSMVALKKSYTDFDPQYDKEFFS